MTTWLAVGDETGNWDSLDCVGPADNRKVVGACLTLAPLKTWADIENERIGTRSAADRLASPLAALPETYPKKNFHHVADASNYLKFHGINSQWSLKEQPSDPVQRGLVESFKWLAGHTRLITVGCWGPLSLVESRSHMGHDPAQALGALYGCLVALIAPFLDPADRLLVGPDLRSENPQSPVIIRSGVSGTASPSPAGHRVHGDTRGLLSALENTALVGLARWYGEKPAAFDKRIKVGTLAYLKEDWHPHRFDYEMFRGAADLGASLMAASYLPGGAIQIPPAETTAGSARFFNLADLLEP